MLTDFSDLEFLTPIFVDVKLELKRNCKIVPVQPWTGHEVSRKLRLPYFMTVVTRKW